MLKNDEFLCFWYFISTKPTRLSKFLAQFNYSIQTEFYWIKNLNSFQFFDLLNFDSLIRIIFTNA